MLLLPVLISGKILHLLYIIYFSKLLLKQQLNSGKDITARRAVKPAHY
jgi:hypothetical protein